MFNEKTIEKINGVELPVLQTDKYKESKEVALKFIKEKGIVGEGDFWILMNKTKDGSKMMYSGLIISHNGCLKINDSLPEQDKFKPNCVTVNENGYGNSLVFTYCNDKQGIYEVGEVSKTNCTNAYPYAMAFKRCFDRVVLKICKLAYAGVYSDSEAEEFTNNYETKLITEEQILKLKELGFDDLRLKKMAQYYKVSCINEVTFEQAEEIIKRSRMND